jgi:hypothetical protein
VNAWQWARSKNPGKMTEFLRAHPRGTPRVWRLWMAAFWVTQEPFINGARDKAAFLKVVATLEAWADTGKAPKRDYTNVFMNRDATEAVSRTVGCAGQSHGGFPTAGVRQAHALREVFGNPFRPVACAPAWLTSDVLALARGIYEEKAFDRMPILADALQDAGCDSDDVLNHLRDATATHVRGCWALDLVLGKG